MDRILGQPRALDQLRAALSSERVHHAFIFQGPAGVGKCTTALAFARILLCHDPQATLTGEIEACGQCGSCRMLARLDPQQPDSPHPDLHLIRKELASSSSNSQLRSRKQTNIPIDLLREFMVGGEAADGRFHEAPAYKTAALRHGKVFIVDEAEMLAEPGQNALLKTLEEPPAGTYIILVTSQPDKLAITIRSRCQRVPFAPLPHDAVARWVDEHLSDLDPQSRDWLITFAGGSLGRAQLAYQYELTHWAREILPQLDAMAKRRYPVSLGPDMAKAIDEFAQAWVKAHDNASKDAANRRGAGLMWSLIARHAQQRLAEQVEHTAGQPPEDAERLLNPWLGVIDAIGHAEQELAANVNMSIVADHLVARMFEGFCDTPARAVP